MVQIQQSTTTTFSALSFEDALVMVSIMDELAERFQKAYKRYNEKIDEPEEKKNKWNYQDELDRLRKEYITLGHQLHTLEKIGFRTSLPGMVQYTREDFPEFFQD